MTLSSCRKLCQLVRKDELCKQKSLADQREIEDKQGRIRENDKKEGVIGLLT